MSKRALLSLSTTIFLLCWVANDYGATAPGKQLATQGGNGIPACATCHGAQGAGQANFPRLAGQPAGYLEKQLDDYKAGRRQNSIMQSMAKNLNARQMKALARFYANLKTPSNTHINAPQTELDTGQELVVNGLWKKSMPACETCHGPGLQGVAPHFPALAGQQPAYLIGQLQAWQKDQRSNDPQNLMKNVVQALSPQELKAVAMYAASQPAETASGQADQAKLQQQTKDIDIAPATADAEPGYFQPPQRSDLPKGQFGDAVRRGAQLFTHTLDYTSRYVGNGLTCADCHVNKGRQHDSAPLWGAWVLYPKYRGKNHKINSMEERIRGCFTYSENAQASPTGEAPAPGDPVLTDLESYMFWLASGAPTGKKMKGQGYPKLKKPAQSYDPERGAKVFAENCALCHGANGKGVKVDDQYVFPPLWGPHSFNWGAGMHRVNTAAGFIRANMPIGKPYSLSDQQAWDVAAFIDSHERPQDPRFDGDIKKTAAQYHQHMGYYGKRVNGEVLGTHPAQPKHR